MSPVTDLKALQIVDRARVASKILGAIERCGGNFRMAADELGCSYHTVWRIIREDAELNLAVVALRKKLGAAGFGHKGWQYK